MRVTAKELNSSRDTDAGKFFNEEGEPLGLRVKLLREFKDDSAVKKTAATHMMSKSMQGYQLIVASRASDTQSREQSRPSQATATDILSIPFTKKSIKYSSTMSPKYTSESTLGGL